MSVDLRSDSGHGCTLLRRMGLGYWQAICSGDGGGVIAPDQGSMAVHSSNEEGKLKGTRSSY